MHMVGNMQLIWLEMCEIVIRLKAPKKWYYLRWALLNIVRLSVLELRFGL